MLRRDMGANPPQQTEITILITPPTDAFQVVTSAFSTFGFALSSDRFEALQRFFTNQDQANNTQLKLHLTIAGDDISKLGVSFLAQSSQEALLDIQSVADTLEIPATSVRFSELTLSQNQTFEFMVSQLKNDYAYGVYLGGWNLFLAISTSF